MRDTNNIHPHAVNVQMSILNVLSYIMSAFRFRCWQSLTCTAPMAGLTNQLGAYRLNDAKGGNEIPVVTENL